MAKNESPVWSQAEQLHHKLMILGALLENTCCERSNGFGTLEDNERDLYLYHCTELVRDCSREAEQIMLRDQAAYLSMARDLDSQRDGAGVQAGMSASE